MSHILLVGFMGAGKSTVARIVAERLGRPCIDLDDDIERVTGITISEMFTVHGEEFFRDRETEALQRLQALPSSVVACGGGIVIRDENRRMLKQLGRVAYLCVSAGETLARVAGGNRPLLSGPGGLMAVTTLMSARESLYAAVADFSLDTVGKSSEQVADAVVEWVSAEEIA